ncbi:hypothetical protein BASA81_010582 [Batrachochytrium salamandrivorans]|nr:hypothetical protein BASA81_010582 [Batrachochytrium salamandrivorans]
MTERGGPKNNTVELDMSEEDLFEDDPPAFKPAKPASPAKTVSPKPASVKPSPKPAKPSSTKSAKPAKPTKPFFAPATASTVLAHCILCYKETDTVQRCRKCFVRACDACMGKGSACTECEQQPAASLDVLLQGPRHTHKSRKLPKTATTTTRRRKRARV